MALSQTIPTSSGLSDLSLCFLTCYFVFGFVVVFSDLLFCFLICHCVFWLVIMFSGLLLCFLNCYFVFYICICVCNLLFCFQNRDLFCTSRLPYWTPFWMHITLSVSKFNDVITASCYSTVRAEHEEKALGWDSVPEGCQHSQSDTCAKTLLCIFIAFYPHRGMIHNWRTM